MKINPNSINPPPKFLLEEFVYSESDYDTTFKTFTYNGSIIARKKLLDLTKKSDLVFYNPELYWAITPKNNKTAVSIFDNNNIELNGLSFKVDKDYSSIIFNRVPPLNVSKCEVVIYEGPTTDNIIYTDGSTSMDINYSPTHDQDLITKSFLSSELSGVQSSFYTLNNLTLKQGGKDLPTLIKYSDNKKLPVVFINQGSEELVISTNPFILNTEFGLEDTYIQLKLGNRVFYKSLLKNIISGLDNNWHLLESSDPYKSNLDTLYLLNSYSLNISNFNLLDFLLRDLDTNPEIIVTVEILCGTKNISASVLVGIDYSSSALPNMDINWDPLDLLNLKTKVVSGVHYFDSPSNKYLLNVNFSFNNNRLYFYRPISFIELGTYDKSLNATVDYKLGLETHIPRVVADQNSTINKTIEICADTSKIFIRLYDNYNNLIIDQIKDIKCSYIDDDERLRLTTPDSSSNNINPNILTEWDSSKVLEGYEPALIAKGLYKLSNPLFKDLSSIAFKISPENHYSHILLDIDYDGEMEIMSLGNTSWLDCEKDSNLFKIPIDYKDPCKIADSKIYSFGRVLYSGPILIRINKASEIKVNEISTI